ncbi:MAG: hypothetical protein ABR498_01135 [Candidatus Dormibacteria bacterium]
MRFRRLPATSWRLIALAAIVAIAAAGCGGSGEGDKSSSQILQDAAAAVKGSNSFHVNASVSSSNGQATFDIKVAAAGTVTGTLTIGGSTANFVIVNGNTYFQGKAFFTQFGGAAAGDLVGDNWVLIPSSQASSATQGLTTFTDTSKLSSCFSSLAGNPYTKSNGSTNGESVVMLQSSQGYTIDIASSARPYPVQITGSGNANLGSACGGAGSTSGNAGSGTINFDGWGQSFTVTPPPNPIDFSSVLGGGSSSGGSSPSPAASPEQVTPSPS